MSRNQFYLYKLFKKSPKIVLSEKEIADFYGISIGHARECIKQDIQTGMIFADSSYSSYYLTPLGFEVFYNLKKAASNLNNHI